MLGGPSNESRLSCGALKKDSLCNLRAPPASSACQAAAVGENFQVSPNSGTVAQAGPPSLAVPAIRASSTPPFAVRTFLINWSVIFCRGTLARRSQHVSSCPARLPELMYTNRPSGGPCAASPSRVGCLCRFGPSRSVNSNWISVRVTRVGTTRSDRPRCRRNSTPFGGSTTVIRSGMWGDGDCVLLVLGMAQPPNGSRLSCGALKKDSFRNLRAPPASSAC